MGAFIVAKAKKTSLSAATQPPPVKSKAMSRPGAIYALKGNAAKATSAAEKRAWLLVDLVARRKARIAEDFYDIGDALRELQAKKLYLALGHASFADMLRARDILGLSQAKKLIAIAATMPRDKALSLGPEKAYALTRYTAATSEPDTPVFLMDSAASIAGKDLGEISARELTKAASQVRKTTGKTKPRHPEEQQATKTARKAQAALRKRGAKTATVEARRTKDGWWLHVKLPVKSADAILVMT